MCTDRLDAFSYLLSFDSRVRALRASIKSIHVACQEVLASKELRFVLATILGVGNALNEGTFAGNARGFKLELLLRMSDVKSTDGKTDLMKYLAQRFYSEFPEPFALPASLAHSSDAAKENFLELDREIGSMMEGMDGIADLALDAEQDSVLAGVLEAFRARTAEQPAALLASMDSAKLEFDKVLRPAAHARFFLSRYPCPCVLMCLLPPVGLARLLYLSSRRRMRLVHLLSSLQWYWICALTSEFPRLSGRWRHF